MIPLLISLIACGNVDAPMDATDSTPVVFEVPKGSTANGIGPALVEAGFVTSEFNWKMGFKMGGLDGSCLKAGKFELRRDMSQRQVLETLCGVPLADDVDFTVLEGWRLRDTDKALADKGFITAGAYLAVTEGKTVPAPFDVSGPTYEGYLFPETYKVPPPGSFDVDKFVVRQLETFDTRFLASHKDEVAAGRGLHDIVIVASLLEREEPSVSNRPVVAGLIFKRLDKGWQLGIDATSHYKLDEWNDRKGLLAALKDPDDLYNTRKRKGLPPTAIGAPSVPSLEAAMAPKDSEWWFYLHDSKGVFHGARNGDEHDANRRKYNVY